VSTARRLLGVPAIALALLVLMAAAPRAQAPQITVVVDPPKGEVGRLMDVTLSVMGDAAADCQLVEPTPQPTGGRMQLVRGPINQQSQVMVNGRITRSTRTQWLLQLIPEKTGPLVIPPFRLLCSGREVQSRGVTVPISGSGPSSDAAELSVTASTDALWTGQVFTVEVTASLDEQLMERQQIVTNGLELDLPWLDGVPGLLRLDTPPPSGSVATVRLAGRRDALDMRVTRDVQAHRLVLSRSIDMLATAPGSIELPAARFSVVLAEVAPSRDVFGALFGEQTYGRRSVVDARSAGPVLVVKGPPEEGRPSSYTNAVGRFRFTATASPTTLRVGDTCTLTLSLTGEGNLEFIEWPAFDELTHDFRLFGKTERKLPRTRVLEVQVSPKNERVTRVPTLELSAFDPDQGTFERLTVGPFDLTVLPGGADGLASLESPSDTLSSLETIREELPAPARAPLPFWIWMVPGALALLGVEAVVRRRQWRDRHPREIERRGARRRLDERLRSAGDVRDIAQAFGKFLSSRLDGPPAGLTAEEASARVRDPALASELRRVMNGWEASYLGGLSADVAAARAEAERLADSVEAGT